MRELTEKIVEAINNAENTVYDEKEAVLEVLEEWESDRVMDEIIYSYLA